MKKLDQIIVIDVEATCWEGNPPDGEESEIIEIGICTVDVKKLERVLREDILVKPEHSSVSDFCQRLTSLTQEEVSEGILFKDACEILKRKYSTKERVLASYGDYDRRQFERQCRSRNINYPFGPTHINVKNLFAITYALPKEIGMHEALNFLKIPLEGTHHRAHDDAWNIANILCGLILKFRSK